MKKILLAIAIAIGFLSLAPAAHAGPKFQKAVTEYLAANDETFTSARHMQEGKTLTKGGFTCIVKKQFFVSHCVERELLAREAKAAARLVAAHQSAQKAAESARSSQKTQKAAPPAKKKADQLSFLMLFKDLDPPNKVKIDAFYPFIFSLLAMAGLLVVAITRKNGRRYNHIGK